MAVIFSKCAVSFVPGMERGALRLVERGLESVTVGLDSGSAGKGRFSMGMNARTNSQGRNRSLMHATLMPRASIPCLKIRAGALLDLLHDSVVESRWNWDE